MSYNRYHNLRTIEVSNFKSIRRAQIDLAPLTVVVGANSSGKSSLLQVVLAISQAVRSGEETTHFPLNGDYAAFGNFGETLRVGTANEEKAIGIRVVVLEHSSRFHHRSADKPEEVADKTMPLLEWQLELVGPEEPQQGHALLSAVQLSLYELDGQGDKKHSFDYELTDMTDTDLENASSIVPVMGSYHSPYRDSDRVVLAAGRAAIYTDDSDREFAVDAVDLVGCLPQVSYKKTDLTTVVIRRWWEWAERERERRRMAETSVESSTGSLYAQRPEAAISRVLDSLNAMIDRFRDQVVNSDDWPMSRHHHLLELDDLLREWLSETEDTTELVDAIMAHDDLSADSLIARLHAEEQSASTMPVEVFYDENSDELFEYMWSVRDLGRYFHGRVKFLGPLREEPRTRYEPKQQQLDLGVTGKYTAAVLYSNSARRVLSFDEHGETRRIELIEAVNEWLAELGLARAAYVEDQGRLGIKLDVIPVDSAHRVDLTSVGVGVSQILPVIVLCLLAMPGDLLVLQQPELHLHPALQQRLGDFFLACAKSGRQLLVETHSEHLVNRLRRRVADPSGWAEDLVSLVFAEQHEGITEYRSSTVNAYGGVDDDWPSGFFDVATDEAQALVATSIAKRSQRHSEASVEDS